MGILLVLAIFKDRKLTSWTPENQVLQRVQNFDLKLSPYARCQLNCLNLDTMQLRSILSKGDVKFGESNVRDTVKLYLIELKNERISKVHVQLKDETALVEDLEMIADIDCNCPN